MFLGDKLNCLKCFSGFILLLGVVLVTQPPFLFYGVPTTNWSSFPLSPSHDDLYYVGVALAGIGGFMGGLARVLIVKCEGVSIPVLVTWSAIWGILLSVGYCLLQPGSYILSSSIFMISFKNWLILLGLALTGLLAFTLMTHALKLISPNLVSSFGTLELVLAFVVQANLTGQSPDTWSCVGGVLILVGVLVLTFQENISEMFSYHPHNGYLYQTVTTRSEYSRLDEADNNDHTAWIHRMDICIRQLQLKQNTG
jgi:drug/metabolite transporter (DMT)-like permease